MCSSGTPYSRWTRVWRKRLNGIGSFLHMISKAERLRRRILKLTAEYYTEAFPARAFVPGDSAVPVSGRVFDALEIQNLVDSSLDFWLTTGRFAEAFQKEF